MRISKPRTGALVLAGLVGLLVAGGIAYATIPDGGGVFTACRLNGVGTIRLIDPSGPSSSLLSRCTQLETQIQWNAKGQQGPPGANGVSPTVAQVGRGDSHCPNGGAAITDANGSIAYVCSAQSFAGTFTSPSGQFSLSVGDGGVQIAGPGSSISIGSGGTLTIAANDETITVQGNRTETVDGNQSTTIVGNRTESVTGNEDVHVTGNQNHTIDGNESVMVSLDRTVKVGNDDKLTVSGNRTEKVSGSLDVESSGAFDLRGSSVQLGAGSVCLPVARQTDLVDPSGNTIITGSATVCAS